MADPALNAAGLDRTADRQIRTVGAAQLTVSHDVGPYLDSIPGLEFDAVRTDRGFGPNSVLTTAGKDIVAVSATTRFGATGRTTMPDGVITAAVVTAAAPGSRWCGIDLAPGTLVVWGDAADHTGQDPAGLGYTFMATSQDRLTEVADQLGVTLSLPGRGQVHTLPPAPQARALGYTLAAVVEEAAGGIGLDINREHDVMHTFISALTTDGRLQRGRCRQGARQPDHHPHLHRIRLGGRSDGHPPGVVFSRPRVRAAAALCVRRAL